MKKRFILAAALFFFTFIPKVDAWMGNYVYDINNVYVSGRQMVISGWGIVKSSSGKEVSISTPTYELWADYYSDSDAHYKVSSQLLATVLGSDSTVSSYLQYAYVDNEKNTYFSAFNRECQNTNTGSDCQYQNVAFSMGFDLTLISNKIKEIKKDVIYVMLRLKIKTTFTNAVPEGFNIAILGSRISPESQAAISSIADGSISSFIIYLTNKVESIVSNGVAQKKVKFGIDRWTCHEVGFSPCKTVTNSPSDLYVRLINGGIYNVVAGVNGITPYTESGSTKYWSYSVYRGACVPHNATTGTSGCDSRNPNTCCFSPGNDGETMYIPAFWVKPYSTQALFTIKSEKEKLPKPPELKKGSITPDSSTTSYDCAKDSSATISLAPNKSFDNGYCSVTCSEKIGFNINPYQTIKAGTGIQYPIAFSGTRICSFGYAPGALNNILTTLNTAANYYKGITKGKYEIDENASLWINLHDSLIGIVNECNSQLDQYKTAAYKYNINPTIDSSKLGSYTRSSEGTLTNTPSAPDYISGSNYSSYQVCKNDNCSETQPFGNVFPTITNGWTLTSTLANVTYRFTNHYYVEKRTGEVVQEKDKLPYHTYYDGGYSYFTKMNDPIGKYTFEVKIDGLARNMSASQSAATKGHDASITCGYYIEKGIKSCDPATDPTCCTNGEECPPKDETPGINVIYRQVSLKDLFPTSGKKYGDNWKTPQALIIVNKIQTLGNDLYLKNPIYTFKVSPVQNLKVKLYNATHKYGEFNLDVNNGLSNYISTSGYYTRGD